MENEHISHPPGWSVSLSIIMSVAWLIFVIVWLAFYAGDYNVYRNIAIVMLSLLVLVVVLGSAWGAWAIRHIPKEGKEMMRKAGFRSRIVVSIIIPFALMIFLIVWFYYYASDYNVYQNIAVFLISILIVGGIMGTIWAPWGMKHKKEFDKYKEEKEEQNP